MRETVLTGTLLHFGSLRNQALEAAFIGDFIRGLVAIDIEISSQQDQFPSLVLTAFEMGFYGFEKLVELEKPGFD